MGKKTTEERLREPFGAREVKSRVGRVFSDGNAGIVFLYVDARACQDRLDEVCGVSGWETAFRFETMAAGAVVICELTANIDGKVVRRSDCTELTDLSDAKGAASTAFKRACACLGVGRYLYNVGEIKARLVNRQFHGKVLLPDEYLPEGERQGRTKLEIEYDPIAQSESVSVPRGEAKDAPGDVKKALEFVIKTGNLKGKKLGEVSEKVLGWLHYNAQFEDERAACDMVYKYRRAGRNEDDTASDDVDIPF